MECISCRSLIIGLLFYLIAFDESIAYANTVIGETQNNELVIAGHKELGRKNMVTETGRSQQLRGRKMRAQSGGKKDDVVQVKGSVETGQVKIYSKKSLDTTSRKDTSGTTMEYSRQTTATKKNNIAIDTSNKKHLGAKSRVYRHNPSQEMATKKLDAVTEMFNMMNKDYQLRPRGKPPINNNIPFIDTNDAVKP